MAALIESTRAVFPYTDYSRIVSSFAKQNAVRGDPRLKEFESRYFYQLGVEAKKRGDDKAAREHFRASLRLGEEWLGLGLKDRLVVEMQTQCLCARVHLGEHAQAAAGADEVRQNNPNDGGWLLKVARVYALCAASDGPDAAARGQYLDKAFATLDQSFTVSRGFFGPDSIAVDPEWAPVRDDPRYPEWAAKYRRPRRAPRVGRVAR